MPTSLNARSGAYRSNIIYTVVAACLTVLYFILPHPGQPSGENAAPAAFMADDCAKAKGIAKVICLADNVKATLNDEQRAALQRHYVKADAQQWSNLPATFGSATRLGLKLGSLTPVQLAAVKALVKEIAGTNANEGFDELQQLLNADDNLAQKNQRDYGAGNYYIAFLGEPSASGMFEIQYGGHHVAFANTYKNGILVGATPSFRGVEPFGKFTQNGVENQPLDQEQTALSAMLTSFSEEQQTAAKLTGTFRDILTGPHKDGQFPATPSGIKCSQLTAAQKKLVLSAINTYVDDIDDKDAAAILKKYTKELDNTFVSFSGTPSMLTRNDYVRIDGPSVWIEYSCQKGVIFDGNHPHSVWRDKANDYGGM